MFRTGKAAGLDTTKRPGAHHTSKVIPKLKPIILLILALNL